MVATDVASRGIGMIKTPSPTNLPSCLTPRAMPSSSQWCYTLNAPVLFILRNLTRAFFVSRFSLKGKLGSVVQHFLLLH